MDGVLVYKITQRWVELIKSLNSQAFFSKVGSRVMPVADSSQ